MQDRCFKSQEHDCRPEFFHYGARDPNYANGNGKWRYECRLGGHLLQGEGFASKREAISACDAHVRGFRPEDHRYPPRHLSLTH